MTRVAIVAGEASGDLLGAALIAALKQRWPSTEFYGIAGPKMIAEGARAIYPTEKLAVRGYVEVIRHLREILAIRSGIYREIVRDRPDLFIGVDAPDFNLALEARLRGMGVKTVHYVSPSVWAWRPRRIHSIGASVDRMLVLLPFEEEIYRKAGIPVSYVGHPLADTMPLEPDWREARAQLRLGGAHTGVALLPGSRLSELEYHSDLMIRTAAELYAKRPELRFFVPLATRETRDYFEGRLYALGQRELPITILFGHAQLALHACDAALVKSGTATLEAALARCPMVVTYKLNRLSYWYAKRNAVLPYYALPNVLSGEFVVPELLQDDATPANLAQALGNWLDNKTAREKLRERFARLHESLAKGHDARVVEALEPFLSPAHAPSSANAPQLRAAVRGG